MHTGPGEPADPLEQITDRHHCRAHVDSGQFVRRQIAERGDLLEILAQLTVQRPGGGQP